MKNDLSMFPTTFVKRPAVKQCSGTLPFLVQPLALMLFIVLLCFAESSVAGDLVQRSNTFASAHHFIDKAATITTVTSLHNPSNYSNGVSIIVTVAASEPSGVLPTGNIKLFIDGIPDSSSIPLSNGNAMNIWIYLSGGIHSVSAQYVGDDNFAASQGTLAGGQTVNRSNIVYPITSVSANPTQAGEAYIVKWETYAFIPEVQFPTGVVTVTDGTDICRALAYEGSCILRSTTPGNKSLIASYQGDNNWDPSVSAGVSHTVLTYIDGRVVTPDGTGIRNANVVLMDAQGVTRSVPSNSLGYFSFDKISLGQSYTVTVRSRRYRFESRNLSITNSSVQGVILTGIE